MTFEPPDGVPVFWGHGIVEPDRAHVRETQAGQPVGGFAICGCLLVADVTDDDVASGACRLCSRCLELLENRRPGVDYPLWMPD
ncbi:hypothetical protein JOF56_011395 [Kibdelosporangium banguiense]|uniref:DUF3039 domain-containing protein n=1 Tax=Kibdelosporangium banguiense TaxID=1365924 RepID=A0ABS4U492_9PSEU|nr:hypothetical protein [Kibdelosporangium banguiense]MBP2331010.1 hypothetical protein [Kibdelosporangium banguiense]